MNHNHKIAAGALALSLLCGPVFAADTTLPPGPQVYVPPPPVGAPPVSPFSWTGPYVGAVAGYGWGDLDGGAALGGDIDANGAVAGAFAGYNIDMGGWVVGGEADFVWSGMTGSNGVNTGDVNWISTARVRAGYDLGRLLIYGTGGLAVGAGEVVGPGVNDTSTHFGWTAGGGVDAALTDNLFARVEYLFTDLGTETYGAAGDVDISAQTVRAGIGLKF